MGATASPAGPDTIRQFYRFIEAGRFGEAIGMLADDVLIREPAELPYGGECHGIDGFRELMDRIGAAAEPGTERVEVLDASNPIVVHLVSRITSRRTGEAVVADVAELYYVRDGRIAGTDIYYKNPSAVAALWAQAWGGPGAALRARLHARREPAAIARSSSSSRSLPKYMSVPLTNIVGVPKPPRATSSSVLRRRRSLSAGCAMRSRNAGPSNPTDAATCATTSGCEMSARSRQ